MLTNYLKTALRSVMRHKISSFINVVGLSIGISAALVIYLIVYHEFNFDKFHRDGDKIYRVVSNIDFQDLTVHNSGVPTGTPAAAKVEVTGLEGSTHFVTADETKVTVPNAGGGPRIFRKQADIVFADNDYFTMFDYHWSAGPRTDALAGPFRVVLTKSRAQAYFPNSSPLDVIGRQIIYEDSITVTVTGVVEDLDEITDLTFREFASMGTVEQTGLKDRWGWNEWDNVNSASQFFVRLMPGTSPANIEAQLAQLRDRHRVDKKQKDDFHHYLQPLSDVHFNGEYSTFSTPQADKPTLYALLAVAAFLLFLGCVNFINLATAQAAQRAKEIGIRKTLGSGRGQLMGQFMGEAFLLTVLAAIVSFAFAQVLLELFKDFIPHGVSFASLLHVHVWLFLGGLILAVSLLSGIYPSFVLTRFQPVAILRNQAFAGTATTRSAWMRRVLTVAQVAIAQFLIIATIVVSKQILFSLNKELGYRKNAIVSFNLPWEFARRGQWNSSSPTEDDKRFVLLERLKAIPGISKISLSGNPPASSSASARGMKVNNGKNLVETMVEVKYADTSYFDLYSMKLVAGRNLLPSDTTKEYVINDTYTRFLGFARPEEALGHLVEGSYRIPIVGVLADFHTKSTRAAIKPLAFSAAANYCHTVHLALNPDNPHSWKGVLDKTESVFKELYPDQDFNARFFDQTIAAFYEREQHTARLLTWAAGLAVFISCLGLLGLAIYTTSARTKEIGIRKVLGASVTGIVSMLSRDFLSLVLIAFVLAAPAGWWTMKGWLEDFAYRTTLSWWVFALACALAVLTALVTISVQAFKAALANPVDSLRTE